ncbi:glycosyltransferase [Methylobacterium iners]|uniref:GDP-mannose:glycolipid 4-beta-D-mannosyltransferase n=1 Tax=Methylobacterium iners TaxID=418707 RepID=A0ABQ4S430_9HYPH|nr:glycosyltransferase [Methylobacterium iners]GJD97880.1 GDP-mannose:glycolipid 4-beta-D-mannosyltransferase [Methylobacterium iners]
MRKSITVYSRPAWKAKNPYTGLLADSLISAGLHVESMPRSFGLLPRGGGVLLFHWPDEFFNYLGIKRAVRALLLLAEIFVAKTFYRSHVVWLVHNVQPHNRSGQTFIFAREVFFLLVDGCIFLSESSREALFSQHQRLAKKKNIVIAHGHYRPCEITVPKLPQMRTAESFKLAFVGQIDRYKGPDLLARVVASDPTLNVEIVIAGSCSDEKLADELLKLSDNNNRMKIVLKYLSSSEIENFVDAADVVVLPYRDILNSGTALLALSRFRPVIAPRLGSLLELREQVGENWLYLYEGDFTVQTLRESMDWLRTQSYQAEPNLTDHEWPKIGRLVSKFLLQIQSR